MTLPSPTHLLRTAGALALSGLLVACGGGSGGGGATTGGATLGKPTLAGTPATDTAMPSTASRAAPSAGDAADVHYAP